MHTIKMPFVLYVFVAAMGCMTRLALAIECETNADCAYLRCEDGGGQCHEYDPVCVENTCVRQNDRFFPRRCAVSEDLPPDSEIGVEDLPFVVQYACNGGNTGHCDTFSDGSTYFDTCTDSGDRSGGGSCTATNWECTRDGVIVSSSTSGTDSCVGFDTPGLTTYECASLDGVVADTCVEVPLIYGEDDCADSGTPDGGGVCDAVDWYCDGNRLIEKRTQGTDTCGGTDDRPNLTYYSCEASDGSFVDSCVAHFKGEPDECYDSGDNLGFGSCTATDWFCATYQDPLLNILVGKLESESSSGSDSCSDAFTTYYSCESEDGGPEGLVDTCVEQQLQDCDDPDVGGLGDVCTNGVCDGRNEGCTTANRPAGDDCRNGDGNTYEGCDLPDTCNESGQCELNIKAAGFVCRAGSGDAACNPDEKCSGIGGEACPPDEFSPEGTACGGVGDIDNDCDALDTCDASGICVDNVKPAGTPCRPGSTDGICDPAEECTGVIGEDCPVDYIEPLGTLCNEGSGDLCDPDEKCTGNSGENCPPDFVEPATTVCKESSTGWEECDPTDFCPGRPDERCEDVIREEGTACGSDSDTACTEPDSCNASGTCLPNNEACALVTSSSLCTFDVQPDKGMCTETPQACVFDAACEAAGGAICGNGLCRNADGEPILDGQNHEIACTDPCRGDGIALDGETDWCRQTGQFRLVFTPDVKNFPAYKLPASNPGQTFYNAVVQGAPNTPVTVGIDIPYPYVTVGGQPVHVFDAYDAIGMCVNRSTGEVTGQACDFKAYPDSECGEGEYCDSSCFAPTVALQQFDIRWNIADYFAGEGMIDDPRVTCDEVCGPDGAGSCTFDVVVPIPASGQAYLNVHLDYGLKGVHEDANPCDGLADRYDQGDSSGTGFADVGFDAWVNNDAGDGALGIGIADCTDYAFGHSVGEQTFGEQTFDDSVQNLNVFKPIAGAFGRSGDSQSGLGHGGLKLTLAKSSNPGTILQTATTDQDGFYTLPYKHKGKPAWYTVSLYDDTGARLLGSIGIELQGNGWTQIDFDSYATFEELCDIDKAFCECNGWCAVAEYGSGRQSGGSSGGGGAVCELAQSGESCTVDDECCSNACKGKPGEKICK